MWAAGSKSKELAVEEMQKTIMLGFSFDSKACAPGTDEVNQGFFCSTGAGCLHSAKSFTGTQCFAVLLMERKVECCFLSNRQQLVSVSANANNKTASLPSLIFNKNIPV